MVSNRGFSAIIFQQFISVDYSPAIIFSESFCTFRLDLRALFDLPIIKIRSCSFYPQNNIGEFLPKYNLSDISAEINISKYYSELKRMSDLPETELIELILNNDDIKQKFKDIFALERSIGFEYETASDSHIMTFTCPIGVDNFFVSARGKLFACNKCDYQMPIGDISTGFNANSLIELYEKYYSKIRLKCSACWAYKQCYMCPAKVMYDNDFVLPTDFECDKIKKSISATFLYYIILNEFENLYEIIKNTIEDSENNMLNFPKSININNYKNENN